MLELQAVLSSMKKITTCFNVYKYEDIMKHTLCLQVGWSVLDGIIRIRVANHEVRSAHLILQDDVQSVDDSWTER